MTTLNIISEQIIRIYSRYVDKNDNKIDIREVRLLVSQVVNKLIKAEPDVSGSVIGTYEYQAQKDDTWYIELNVIPLRLPKEQGIHRVYPKGCPFRPFIPIQTGDFDLVQGTPSEYIEGQIGYWLDGKKVRFTRQVPPDITAKIVVVNPTDPNDILPIPPDMEMDVIQGVLAMFGLGQISQAELNSKNEREVTNERER